MGGGHELVHSYLMPTLPATIISPLALSKHNGCTGYVTMSNLFSTGCHIELQNCQRRSQNLQIDLQQRVGLLYTGEVLRPLAEQQGLDSFWIGRVTSAPIRLKKIAR